jgi:GMP synthase (glutamine-hydrolysing)
VRVIRSNAQNYFFNVLSNEHNPELKRKIIGNAFIDIFNLEAKKLKNINFLAQGTIYPDVIESAGASSGKAKVIKSHHNVGGLPEDLQFDLVEPLKELFKDEVREIGLKLGLPKKMLYRHPFPGPGLGVRILGPIKEEFAEILRKADHIFMEELNNQKLYDKVDQAFAVFLPVKSVGVTGDERRYDYVIALRAVETIDFMTASWARLPYEFLDHVSNRIMNEISRVSRVVYDISGKPPSTIEWE